MSMPDSGPWIERLAHTTAFKFLLAVAVVVIVPVLVVGVFIGVPMALVAQLGDPASGAVALIAIVVAGVAGMIGLARCRRHGHGTARREIERTQALLVIGIITALGLAAPLVWVVFETWRSSSGLEGFALFGVGSLVVMALKGLAEISRLASLQCARDMVPLTFFGLALSQLAVVAGVTLSF